MFSSLAGGPIPRSEGHVIRMSFADDQRCDVYVAAGVQVDLAVRLKIIAELWRNGISADLQYDDDRTLDDVTEECEDQSTP